MAGIELSKQKCKSRLRRNYLLMPEETNLPF